MRAQEPMHGTAQCMKALMQAASPVRCGFAQVGHAPLPQSHIEMLSAQPAATAEHGKGHQSIKQRRKSERLALRRLWEAGERAFSLAAAPTSVTSSSKLGRCDANGRFLPLPSTEFTQPNKISCRGHHCTKLPNRHF